MIEPGATTSRANTSIVCPLSGAAWPGGSSTTWSVRTKPGIRVVGTDRVWPSQQQDHGNRAATE
jgi:hypothetical protein